jgi:hypothetical protein
MIIKEQKESPQILIPNIFTMLIKVNLFDVRLKSTCLFQNLKEKVIGTSAQRAISPIAK